MNQLRLSLFTVPDLSIGRAPLTPQNSQFDSRRVAYLDGMVAYLESLFDNLRGRYSRSEALSRFERCLAQLPYAELVKINLNGGPIVSEIPTARDRIVFNQNPSAGSHVEKGGTVTISVSSGPPKVSVPDVKGQQWTDAQQALAALKR